MSTYVHHARVPRTLHASIAVIVAISLLACSRDAAPTATPGVGPAVALSITTPAVSLVVGDGASVSARAVDAGNRTVAASVTWSSADPAIATIRKVDGYVVGVSPGSTVVTARAGALSATATVSVRPPDPPVSVSISPNAVSVIVGGVERLVARAVDSTGRGANVSFEWMSADPAVATVGKTDGMVTAIAPGTTTVTVSTGTVSATATISVIDFAGSFAFTRTSSSGGRFASDVLI